MNHTVYTRDMKIHAIVKVRVVWVVGKKLFYCRWIDGQQYFVCRSAEGRWVLHSRVDAVAYHTEQYADGGCD